MRTRGRQAGRPLSPGNTTFSRRPMDVRPTAHQFACTTKQRGGNHRPGATLSSLLNECMEKAPSRAVGSSQTPGMRASGLQKSNQSGGERPEPPVLSLSADKPSRSRQPGLGGRKPENQQEASVLLGGSIQAETEIRDVMVAGDADAMGAHTPGPDSSAVRHRTGQATAAQPHSHA